MEDIKRKIKLLKGYAMFEQKLLINDFILTDDLRMKDTGITDNEGTINCFITVYADDQDVMYTLKLSEM